LGVTINGVQILAGNFISDTVINLGSDFGPQIDLKISNYGSGGSGSFVFGGAVPEPSTWAMMLLGFAGLGYAGHRRAREPRAA
jgi:PEP-CTERM motif